MNATNLYVTTCRLVMHAQPENRDTWLELYKLLPYLRQSLSCTVCGKLLIEPYTPTETTCQHHVCKMCLGGKKRLKPTCSWCRDYDMYVDNAQIKLLLQCYKKLCEYIKFTPIYCKLNSIYNNGGQLSLIDMIDEAVGKTNNNKCEENNSILHCDEYEIDSKENIRLIEETVHNENISADDSFKENSIFDECTSETDIPLAEEKDLSTEDFVLSSTDVSAVDIDITPIITESECKEDIKPLPILQTLPSHAGTAASSVGIGTTCIQGLGPITHPLCSTTITSSPSVTSPTTGSLSVVKSPSVPTQTPLLPAPHHHYPPQMIPTTLTSLPSGTSTSGCGFPPGTIFPSTKSLVTHSVAGEMASFPPKHNNASVNNGSSSMYSVMYADGDSTKITIKRKPPGMDTSLPSLTTAATCTNKTISIPVVESEPIIPEQELIKKPKPKPKPKPKRKGCRCGNATPTPGKLTCCGQRCPCYVEAKACIECRCRGCRNPHRPGGKKVRPVIPQLANIQIHQVQPVHGRSSTSSSSSYTTTTPTATTTPTSNTTLLPASISSPAITNTSLPQTIRAVQAMHAVQAVHGVNTTVQAMTGGMHQLIALGGGVVQTTPLTTGLGVHPMTGLAMKPVSLALTSVPAQLLINDDGSTSASTSDNSDVDIDI